MSRDPAMYQESGLASSLACPGIQDCLTGRLGRRFGRRCRRDRSSRTSLQSSVSSSKLMDTVFILWRVSMRIRVLRGVVALVVVCAFAAPALAQSVVRGKVTDAQGKPVPDAMVEFASTDSNRRTSTKTDKNGEFLQVGLQSGGYKVTASKQGVGSQTKDAQVKQGPSTINFAISAATAAATPENKAETAA